jgi:GTP-binding protein
MIIKSAKFIKSSQKLSQCPAEIYPEFAFIGRSNVGKSSLINMLAGFSRLAKISSTPGKTKTINHFLINEEWYLVDLPGYGYAKLSASERNRWIKETGNYITGRNNLVCLFVLLDSRIEPQQSDLEFMEMLGENRVPFARVFTKSDKLKEPNLKRAVQKYDKIMLDAWEEVPLSFIASVKTRRGRDDLLEFIEQSVNNYRNGS